MQSDSLAASSPAGSALWACPFRPFFLATAAWAVLALVAWLGGLMAGWPLPESIPFMQWHSHEMLFGMVAAAIAGFLLTAMCNWTGATPLSGGPLKLLFGLWVAGRLAMWSADWLGAGIVAVVDLSFLAAVAIYAGRVIIGAGNYRNLPLVAVVTALWLTNLVFHAGLWHDDPELVRHATLSALMLIVLLMVIVGGRITPAFTRNWLMRRGQDPAPVRTRPWLEASAIVTTALTALLLMARAPDSLIATGALLAGAATGLRVIGWSGWLAWRDPLVWILHLSHAWIPLGLILMGLALGPRLIADTAWLHALGSGAMGVMILGVMTRVSLGHTGRELVLPSGALVAYALIIAAAVIRILAALSWIPWHVGLSLSGLAWTGAFGVFLVVYWPVLSRPRADGRPG